MLLFEVRPLVAHDDASGRLTIPESALALLCAVEDDIAVVAMAGAARGGKSFLLNCLAAPPGRPASEPPPRRFDVGPNVNPCTQGLWCAAPSPCGSDILRGPEVAS